MRKVGVPKRFGSLLRLLISVSWQAHTVIQLYNNAVTEQYQGRANDDNPLDSLWVQLLDPLHLR